MKNKSLDLYYEKMRRLSDLDNTVSHTSNSETLVEHITLNDGRTLGIVKNAHKYYVKSSNSNNNTLNESDFTYLTGIANSHEYSYKSLAIAQRQMDLLKNQFNNAYNLNESLKETNKNRKYIKEDLGYDYIIPQKSVSFFTNGNTSNLSINEKKELIQFKNDIEFNTPNLSHFVIVEGSEEPKRFNDVNREICDTVKIKAITKEVKNENLDDDLNDLQVLNDKISHFDIDDFHHDKEKIESKFKDMNNSNGVEDENEDESQNDNINNKENSNEIDDESNTNDEKGDIKSIEKLVGKLTYDIRNSDLTPNQIKSFFNSLTSSFKEHIGGLDHSEKLKLKNKVVGEILNVSDDEEITEDLDLTLEDSPSGFNEYVDTVLVDVNELTVFELVNLLINYFDLFEIPTDEYINQILDYEIINTNIEEISAELRELGYEQFAKLLNSKLPYEKDVTSENVDIELVDMEGDEESETDKVNILDTPKTKNINILFKDDEVNIQLTESELRDKIREKLSSKKNTNEDVDVKNIEKYIDFIIDKYI